MTAVSWPCTDYERDAALLTAVQHGVHLPEQARRHQRTPAMPQQAATNAAHSSLQAAQYRPLQAHPVPSGNVRTEPRKSSWAQAAAAAHATALRAARLGGDGGQAVAVVQHKRHRQRHAAQVVDGARKLDGGQAVAASCAKLASSPLASRPRSGPASAPPPAYRRVHHSLEHPATSEQHLQLLLPRVLILHVKISVLQSGKRKF